MANVIQFAHESASAIVIDWEDGRASLAEVFSAEKRKGHATGLINKVIAYADENRLTLILAAQAHGDDRMTNIQLQAFYEKFGFVATTDADEFIMMERKFK